MPIELMEIFYIRHGPQGHGSGRIISFHFQLVYRKFPIYNCLISPPVNLFSNKHKPFEKVLRLIPVNIQPIAIAEFPHHCIKGECLEVLS